MISGQAFGKAPVYYTNFLLCPPRTPKPRQAKTTNPPKTQNPKPKTLNPKAPIAALKQPPSEVRTLCRTLDQPPGLIHVCP